MQRYILLFAALCTATALVAQSASSFSVQRNIEWPLTATEYVTTDGETLELWNFKGASHDDIAPTLPVFSERIVLSGPSQLVAELTATQWEAFDKKMQRDDAAIPADIQPQTSVSQAGQQWLGWVRLATIRKVAAGRYERLKSFTLTIRVLPLGPAEAAQNVVSERGPGTISALSDGTIYKFGVAQSAVYKLDYTWLKEQLGISDLSQIDPRTIRIYGNGGVMLPERNNAARPDDLLENAIFISGEADGKFDATDYILLYATGPKPWQYRPSTTAPQLTMREHYYDRNAWYFIKIGGGDGTPLRLGETANIQATASTEEFDDVQRFEEETVNLLDYADAHQGSGKRWLGDRFEQTRSKAYELSFPNIVAGSSGRVRMEFAARCAVNSTVRLKADNTQFSATVNSVSTNNNDAAYASSSVVGGAFTPDNDQIQFLLEYPNTTQSSEGWLDYIEVNVRRRLTMDNAGKMMEFRDIATFYNPTTTFRLGGAAGNMQIWDITNRQVPARQSYTLEGSTAVFGADTDSTLRNYIAFFDNAPFPVPEAKSGKIANQNLHALDNTDMVILYPAEFEGPVQQLAQHRRDYSGLTVTTIRTDQVFNEFSSGTKDPVAIRDLARMLYERNPQRFKYLLLFGDGSFDPKNNSKGVNNDDFVMVWETDSSFDPVQSHPSDDFFGLLSPTEDGNLVGSLDIAVGRIPSLTQQDAQVVVDKIIAYDKQPQTLGDWHNRLMYIADHKESEMYHINQADQLAENSIQQETWFNIEKVYLDAYEEVATSSEKRSPGGKAAINANIYKGVLTTTYIGHGGPRGWSQKRVVDNADILGWENFDRQTFFITATCSFGGYDDYKFQTGGEEAILSPSGGGVGLFTTVRPVFITANDILTDAVQLFIYNHGNGSYRSVGDILKDAKNTLSSSTADNARRFTLIGDPAMFLAMPEHRVSTDSINGRLVNSNQPDTLRALQSVSIAGHVNDVSGAVLGNYNGRVSVTVFDKKQTLKTLGQSGASVKTFTVQRNILFRGSATVTNGRFRIEFVVPKDINYAYGAGKISYYAENGTPFDASGADNSIIVGGSSNLVKDDKPPVVLPYLNTDVFVFGGITDENPKILVRCADDFGMNVSGTSLGHDLTAVLDGNVLETVVLNEFYQSEQDNYRKGQAIYPLRNLALGKHTLKVKGWDVANNPGEGYTEFIVSDNGQAALEHVLNYPNPFTTNTAFQFEHNLAGQLIDVQINVFTVSGKLVKTIQHTAPADGYRVTDITWDGKDDYGDQLARGVYVYRVKLRGTDVSGQQVTAESDFEKLVLLK